MAIRIDAELAAGCVPGPPDDLCLSFANTRYWRGTDIPTEELRAPPDLLRWCASTAGVGKAIIEPIALRWSADPATATAALGRAIVLREALYRIFSDVSAGVPVAHADVGTVNAALGAAAGRSSLVRAHDRWTWAIPRETSDLSVLLA